VDEAVNLALAAADGGDAIGEDTDCSRRPPALAADSEESSQPVTSDTDARSEEARLLIKFHPWWRRLARAHPDPPILLLHFEHGNPPHEAGPLHREDARGERLSEGVADRD
jgi:hypothetical protein